MTEAHVPPSVQFRVAVAGAGGDAFVGHTKRDHINYVNRLKMKLIEGGDAATLINLMSSRQAEESRYNLICGAFVGINNHWSNVMFGCAFLSNEREESFEWLFNIFNEFMGDDVRPILIFTDQDQAIANAIETVYPQTRHRPCQWHIQQNAISHFGKLKGDRPFQNLFNKCLHGCYSETEFEETWHKMLTEYGLVNHSWFKRFYKHRAKWSTALNNQFFSAGILSSQRSESTNHAMGFQASKTTSVTEFFQIFENTVYTLELFQVFEKEFALSMGTLAVILPIDDPEVLLYRVSPASHDEDDHHVTYDCQNNLTECTCRNFQVKGMLCSHIIRVFHMHSVVEIPDRYILRRWTKFSKTTVWERLLPSDIRRSAAHDAINCRRSMLTAMKYLITKCQNVSDARVVVDKLFIKADEEVELLSKLNMEEDQPTVEVSVPPILDPVRCTTKG
ncbi:protein FAR1-RELATED SEQUENCE 5-like [Silene latifolia]|uniref:protein FAR1-RELATED SEQUENCE 5-like n=1 Tax=Silene latifolia TaxID=37657 RepID=UPI003D773EAC